MYVASLFYRISITSAISADPDQTPHYAASDLDLHCLPMPLANLAFPLIQEEQLSVSGKHLED